MEDAGLMGEETGKKDIRLFFSLQYRKIVNSFKKRYGDVSQMEIEDVVSELMTDLFSKADIGGQIENIGAYIYRSVQNRLVDYLRRKKKTSSLEILSVEDEPFKNPDISMESREIQTRLAEALALLKPAEREIWVATEIEGEGFKELSEEWEIPIGTLLARKHRANSALQKHLYDLRDY